MSARLRRTVLLVLLGAGVVVPLGRAEAQEPAATPAPDPAAEARHQYNVGKAAYESRRFAEAALAWEAAAAIKPHAATLFSAALAWEKAGHPDRAADDFGRAMALPGLTAEQTKAATGRLGALERTLGTLEVTGPEGWRVQLDGLTEVAVPGRLHAVPGEHALLVRAPGQPAEHRDVALQAGQTTPLALADHPADLPTPTPPPNPPLPPPPQAEPTPAPPVEAPPPPPPPTPTPTLRYAGVGVLGMGVATLGAAVVLGVEALGARNAYDASPSPEAYDHAHQMQGWTNAAFIVGGVLVGGGLALALWPAPKGKAAASLRLTPAWGGASLGGAF